MTSHPSDPHEANGVPKLAGSIELAFPFKGSGIADRYTHAKRIQNVGSVFILETDEARKLTVKNQILIPFGANSVTQTPPPAAANGAPYDKFVGLVMMQPSLLLA